MPISYPYHAYIIPISYLYIDANVIMAIVEIYAIFHSNHYPLLEDVKMEVIVMMMMMMMMMMLIDRLI